jgi:hypothetical protein
MNIYVRIQQKKFKLLKYCLQKSYNKLILIIYGFKINLYYKNNKKI